MQRFREPTSGFTHLAGAVLAALALVWLIAETYTDSTKLFPLVIYGVSTLLIYIASSTLHLVHGSPARLQRLRRLDHASIYLGIAGTYTPFCLLTLPEGWRWGTLIVIWLLALAGILYKLFFQWRRSLSTLVYVGMGWLALIPAPLGITRLPVAAVLLLLAGGLVYSIGAVIYALDKPNLHRYFNAHDLWHIFVMVGSVLHFAAVMFLLKM